MGGAKIDPSKIYASNVTIASFADDLYETLSATNPSVLEELCIEPDRDGKDIVGESPDLSNTMDYAGADFENGIIGNRRVYEGMRGVFTFMVLWDHYHPTNIFMADSFAADTALFVIISGFTTALQLRDVPQRSDKDEAFEVLKPRGGFDWQSFLTGRAVGIFPILWLVIFFFITILLAVSNTNNTFPRQSLIVNAQRWKESDDYLIDGIKRYTRGDSAMCAFLYTVGMQSWVRPICKSAFYTYLGEDFNVIFF